MESAHIHRNQWRIQGSRRPPSLPPALVLDQTEEQEKNDHPHPPPLIWIRSGSATGNDPLPTQLKLDIYSDRKQIP